MSSDIEYVQNLAKEGGGVKQLKQQLQQLSQATKQRNDYMDDMKKVSGVKDRIKSIEGNLKSSPTNASSIPMPSEHTWKHSVLPRTFSTTGTGSRGSSTIQNESSNGSSNVNSLKKTLSYSPETSSVDILGEEKVTKVFISPSLGKMKIEKTEKKDPDADPRLLRPSLARRMSANSFPTSKLMMSSSLVKRSTENATDSVDATDAE